MAILVIFPVLVLVSASAQVSNWKNPPRIRNENLNSYKERFISPFKNEAVGDLLLGNIQMWH